MIIRNASVFSKGQKTVILAVSLLVDAAIFIVLISTAIITYCNNDSNITNNIPVIAILAIIGTVSVSDFIVALGKRKSIALAIVRWFISRKGNLHQFGIEIHPHQRQFCEKIVGNQDDHTLIYLLGKENKGKSTAVLYLLSGLLINSEDVSSLPWFNNITFIDCTNNREEIVNFFNIHDSELNRIKRFSNCLVVIDNVECLGALFIEENIGLFTSSRSIFIIIEDTRNSEPMCSDVTTDNSRIYNFNDCIISVKKQINLYKELIASDSLTKNVFFALYFSTLVSSFVKKKTICDILKISRRKFRKAYGKIKKMKIFLNFPYNKSYSYCFRRNDLRDIDEKFDKDLTYNFVLSTYINSDLVDSETKWRCLIRCDVPSIELVSQKDRYKMFHKALFGGNYQGLYDELKKSIKRYPKKSETFLYERAFLAFYVGYHEESTNCYSELIKAQKTFISKKELMLHIIESSHGNPNATNMKMVNDLISTLSEENDFYSVCAKYWRVHIQSEKGIFSCNDMESVRKSISKYTNAQYNNLKRSILHRTYTDEIRFCHILGIDSMTSLYEEYERFLTSCSTNRYDYYFNLYIEANNIHYIMLLNSVLSDSDESDDIEELVRTADYYYKKALNSSYNDEKSRRATVVKQADLHMMYWDFNYEDVKKKINTFRLHSQLNNVGVHEAFCETLLMKASIVNPDNMTDDGFTISSETTDEVNTHYNRAKEIFDAYQNSYGLYRLDFMMAIFELLTCTPDTIDACIEKLLNLSKNHPQYTKEQIVVDALYRRKEKDKLSKMFIISIIKAYPIILQ